MTSNGEEGDNEHDYEHDEEEIATTKRPPVVTSTSPSSTSNPFANNEIKIDHLKGLVLKLFFTIKFVR